MRISDCGLRIETTKRRTVSRDPKGSGDIADFGLPFESLRALSMVEGRIEKQRHARESPAALGKKSNTPSPLRGRGLG